VSKDMRAQLMKQMEEERKKEAEQPKQN